MATGTIEKTLKRTTLTIPFSGTWGTLAIPSTIKKVINVKPSDGAPAWILWRVDASNNLVVLRLNTSSTNITVINTTADFSVEVFYE